MFHLYSPSADGAPALVPIFDDAYVTHPLGASNWEEINGGCIVLSDGATGLAISNGSLKGQSFSVFLEEGGNVISVPNTNVTTVGENANTADVSPGTLTFTASAGKAIAFLSIDDDKWAVVGAEAV